MTVRRASTHAVAPAHPAKPARSKAAPAAAAAPRAGGWSPKAGGAKRAAPVEVRDDSVGTSQISRALEAAAKTRLGWLKDFSKAQRPSTVLPEDLSLHVKTFHMAVTGGDVTGGGLVPHMARIGKAEGFGLVVRTIPEFKAQLEKEYRAAGLDNVEVVTMQTPNFEGGDFWTEDQGDLDAKGDVAVPALLRKGKQPPSFTGQAEAINGRVSRGWKDPQAVPVVGAVGMRDSQESLAALAVAAGRKLRVNLSHVEGGNQLTGTLPSGERYALVGKDSMVVTGALLSRELGRRATLDDVRRAIAADLGVSPQHVFDIEQPGDFHLDMAMSLMKPGQVLLNDAQAAFTAQSKWLEDDQAKKKPEQRPSESPDKFKQRLGEWTEDGKVLVEQLKGLKKATAVKAGLEKLAERDLKAAGLQVVRVPGVFLEPRLPTKQVMNFLNGEGGIGASGKSFFITQGGDPRAQAQFKQALDASVGVGHVHFLDRTLSALTLGDLGGISCRARAEGTVA